jgi:hypothetical protein
MTAVEFLIEQICGEHTDAWEKEIKQAIEMEKEQREKMYSEEEVIAIVEKSRETGLTAEYLLLTGQFKKK